MPEFREQTPEPTPMAHAVSVTMASGVTEEGGFDAMLFAVELETEDGQQVTVSVAMPVEMAQELYMHMSELLTHYLAHGLRPPT
jgi:hypothetical protein